MTHFKDLTIYTYGAATSSDVGARNIGWLAADIEFQIAVADPAFVERLWRFCRISIGQTRGLHECELCRSSEANSVCLKGEKLLLGSAEIRVLSRKGETYAAPNLVYHYVTAHNYSPPAEFVEAVLSGPSPPDEEYFPGGHFIFPHAWPGQNPPLEVAGRGG